MESQVRALSDRNLVVGMEVALTTVVSEPQILQHLRSWEVTEILLAEQCDDIRLPPTVHTPPRITFEAKNAQSVMASIVSAFNAGASAFVVVTLLRPAMSFASSAAGQLWTARERAGTEDARSPHIRFMRNVS